MNQNPKEARDQFVRDAKSNLILDAACRVFAEKGYHAARLEDIAAVSGFSKASLYNYYEDKESLFLNLLVRMHEKIIAELKKDYKPECSVFENLTAIFKSIFRLYKENFAISMVITDFKTIAPPNIEKVQKHHSELMKRFKEYQKEVGDLMFQLLSNARLRGEIGTSIDDKTLISYIESLIKGALYECNSATQQSDTEQRTKNMIDFISRGMNLKSV